MSGWDTTATANLSIADKYGDQEASQDSKGRSAATGSTLPPQAVETAAKAHELGWAQPLKYNYELYNSSNPAERERLLKAKQVGESGPDEINTDYTGNIPQWASGSAKYEWSDEYGEVGPRVPELEAILFNDQFLQRRGDHMAALNLDVTVESETRVAPIREVRYAPSIITPN